MLSKKFSLIMFHALECIVSFYDLDRLPPPKVTKYCECLQTNQIVVNRRGFLLYWNAEKAWRSVGKIMTFLECENYTGN